MTEILNNKEPPFPATILDVFLKKGSRRDICEILQWNDHNKTDVSLLIVLTLHKKVAKHDKF